MKDYDTEENLFFCCHLFALGREAHLAEGQGEVGELYLVHANNGRRKHLRALNVRRVAKEMVVVVMMVTMTMVMVVLLSNVVANHSLVHQGEIANRHRFRRSDQIAH